VLGSEQLNDASDTRIAATTQRSKMTRIETSRDTAGRDIEATNCSGGTMFKFIARYAPAVAAVGVLTIGSFGLTAHGAESVAETPSVTVLYADLDLNTPAGIEALYGRLSAAARQVCDVRGQRPLAETIQSKTCYRQVLGAALDDAKLLTSTARHRAEHTGNDVS